MKKTFGRKLAFLFVATLLAAGTFTSCADNEEETANTPADSLAKPTGTDPFTTGWYKANITDSEGHNYDMYYIFDTAERTVDVQEKKEPFDKMKYTYTANTVTMALYKVTVPDIDAWVSFQLSDDDSKYPTEWKFVDKSEFISFVEEVSKKLIPLIEQQLQDTTLSDKTRREYLEETLDYWKNEAKNDAIEESKEFDEPAVTYAYTKTGNVITLTNNTATEKIVLTLIND